MYQIYIPLSLLLYFLFGISNGYYDVWNDVPCNRDYYPENCEPENLYLHTIQEYERCGPAYMERTARNFFLAAAGRRLTYKENKNAFNKIKILPKMLRDVSNSSIATTILGQQVKFPIGFAPAAAQKLAHPDGEFATLSAILDKRMIMILSSLATASIEDIGLLAENGSVHLWMQVYIFIDRNVTIDIVKRAERNGFKAIVLTVDSAYDGLLTCRAKKEFSLPDGVMFENIPPGIDPDTYFDPSITFEDITWLRNITKLPIVAKGILSGRDAIQAVLAGASAILVSNQGGRQMDGTLATIDALPDVVSAVRSLSPNIEVYMDSGIRNGHDIYKAIARGAQMVFIGRPIVYGLAIGGDFGVRNVIEILVEEFNNTMLVAGASNLSMITSDTIISPSECTLENEI